jgi:GDP-D-mannose dehydratase
MQIYKEKEYMERDLHVINEDGNQEVLRIMDEDFYSLHAGNNDAPEDWKEINDTVEMYMPLDKLLLTSDEDVVATINQSKQREYKIRTMQQPKKRKWYDFGKN